MQKEVYVVIESGVWEYEPTFDCEVFDSFEKAYDSYKEKIKTTKIDILNFIDEDEVKIEENVDLEKKCASCCIYENGDYSQTHNDIRIEREVIK